jgi:hypothetical protein
MKKILLLLLFAGCTAEEIPEKCICTFDVKRYISFNHGETWSFNRLDNRNGIKAVCSMEREYFENPQDRIQYKLVFKCRE